MEKAILIIDLLQEFFLDGRLKKHRETLAKNINELVDAAHASKVPIVWIRQEYKPDLSDAPLYNRKNNKPITIAGTEGAKWLPELHKEKGDNEVVKKRYSAFFKTDLDRILEKLGANNIIIAGINTMTCVRVTAIDAYQRDYNVILALDCVDAYDIEQHKNSIKYLQYAIAAGKDNKTILKLIKATDS